MKDIYISVNSCFLYQSLNLVTNNEKILSRNNTEGQPRRNIRLSVIAKKKLDCVPSRERLRTV